MITVADLPAPAFDRREILRYARAGEPTDTLLAMLEECIDTIRPLLCYRICYESFPVRIDGKQIDLGFACVTSAALAKFLKDASGITLIAATVGFAPDRMVARASVTSPTRALLYDAIGTERIEALCDAFSNRPRFSPGYGDLPLTFQREIFGVLDCPRKIGLSLTDSLLMSPSKSVTAILNNQESI